MEAEYQCAERHVQYGQLIPLLNMSRSESIRVYPSAAQRFAHVQTGPVAGGSRRPEVVGGYLALHRWERAHVLA